MMPVFICANNCKSSKRFKRFKRFSGMPSFVCVNNCKSYLFGLQLLVCADDYKSCHIWILLSGMPMFICVNDWM